MNLPCLMIRFYQRVLAPVTKLFGAHCRFYPSCSEYAYLAFSHYPWWKALRFASYRVWRCQPWFPGGIDHLDTGTVPPQETTS